MAHSGIIIENKNQKYRHKQENVQLMKQTSNCYLYKRMTWLWVYVTDKIGFSLFIIIY